MPKLRLAMNKLRALLAIAALLFPVLCFSQSREDVRLDSCVQEMSGRCPIDQGKGWVINSIEAKGDTVAVELLTPALLNGFLSMLMGDGVNVKRLWLGELMGYGDSWKQMFELMSENGRSLLFTTRAQGSRKQYSLVMSQEEIGTILATSSK